ncbi:MAG: hypothetical protein AB1726_16190 [Planctomycetota bacterium]
MRVANGGFELTLGDSAAPTALVCRPAGLVLANLPYDYGRPAAESRVRVEGSPAAGAVTVIREVAAGPLRIAHRFVLERGATLQEYLTVRNAGPDPVAGETLRLGFRRELALPADPFLAWTCTDIPLRRDPANVRGRPEDYPTYVVARDTRWCWDHRRSMIFDPCYGSDGWALWGDGACVVVFKHAEGQIEYALVDGGVAEGRPFVRFGGAGLLHGDPEGAAVLDPGETVAFGVTTLTAVAGDWRAGYEAFREEMRARGYRSPPAFDPPVHWNELYDNPLWWGPDTPERRAAHYRREDMLAEAAKAQEIGAEALYLDPGWDTTMSSTIWAEERLGPLAEFVALLRERYGLALSLHTPLAVWTDGSAYSREIDRVGADGQPIALALCGTSEQYLEEKARRLLALAEAGVAYFMFDGSAWTGPCWSARHGHSIPSTREDQLRAYAALRARIHARHPDLLIEQHDPVMGGTDVYYVPRYRIVDRGAAPTELWGYELMWAPWDDLVSGRALANYYQRLAHDLPVYLHIDLRGDNRSAIVFWWNASTCQHLGIGGRHADPAVWAAQKEALALYLRLKPYFTRGELRGVQENIHAHVLASQGVVLNLFNLGETATTVRRRIAFSELGPGAPAPLRSADSRVRLIAEGLELAVPLEAWDHALLELSAAGGGR